MLSFHYNYRYGIIPWIPIKFKSKTFPYYFGLIDTGSSHILINSTTVEEIELQRSENTIDWESSSGKFKVRKAKVDLIFGHAKRQELFENVEIYVSEIDDYPKIPLIGRHPLFEWYNVKLDNVNNRCILTPK